MNGWIIISLAYRNRTPRCLSVSHAIGKCVITYNFFRFFFLCVQRRCIINTHIIRYTGKYVSDLSGLSMQIIRMYYTSVGLDVCSFVLQFGSKITVCYRCDIYR